MKRQLCVALLASSLLACASPRKKAQDATAELESWTATLSLLARERARGTLPEPYAEQVRRAAATARERAKAQLRQARSP